jgi:hypothetical protein
VGQTSVSDTIISRLFGALNAWLSRNQAKLPEDWEKYCGEMEFWEVCKLGESIGKADDVELTYVNYRESGLSPPAALNKTMQDWDFF